MSASLRLGMENTSAYETILKWCQGGYGKYGLDVRTPCMRNTNDGKKAIIDVSRAAVNQRVAVGATWDEVLGALRGMGANIP